MNWNVFFIRLGSAVVFAAIMMLGLLYPSPYAIFLLVLAIQFLCIREFFVIMPRIFPDRYYCPAWVPPVFHLLGVWIVTTLATFNSFLVCILILAVFVIWCAALLSRRTPLHAVLFGFLAMMYISVPMGFLVLLRSIHWVIPLTVILMIWMNDTMAYIVGSFVGKHSFSPISPKKTWEGTIGGALLTLTGAALWGYYCPLAYFDIWDWLIMAVLVIIAGTAGDLLESKLKRLANLKDSGVIMPGHGGALDRFDSMLMALPFVFCYVFFFMTLQ